MSLIRPYLIVLFLAVLMLHTVVPVAAADPPLYGADAGSVVSNTDKDTPVSHPNGGGNFWGTGVPADDFYVVTNEDEHLIPLGPDIRLIVIFRGGKLDDVACRTYITVTGVVPSNCTIK